MSFKITSVEPATKITTPNVKRVTYTSAVDGISDWAMIKQNDGENGRTWVVHIHGHGSTGDQPFTRADIRDLWLPCYFGHGLSLLSVNLRGNAWMNPAAATDLCDLLQHLKQGHKARRIILASGSMGGTSNVIFAALHPQMIDAAIALCPATDISSYHDWCLANPTAPVIEMIRLAIESNYSGDKNVMTHHSAVLHADRLTMPLYVVHGAEDKVIPVSEARNLAAKMSGRDNFYCEEIAGGDHEIPLRHLPPAMDWVLRKLA